MKCPECETETRPYWGTVYGIGYGKRYYKCRCGFHWDSDYKEDQEEDDDGE